MSALDPLRQVAALKAEAAEASLAALRREESQIRSRLAELDAARRDRAARALAPDLALRAGADLRWEGWVGRRAAEMTAELARLLARIEAAKAQARREGGRREAVEALAREERADRAARAARAEERRLWEGRG